MRRCCFVTWRRKTWKGVQAERHCRQRHPSRSRQVPDGPRQISGGPHQIVGDSQFPMAKMATSSMGRHCSYPKVST
ncbi:hypothetical protein VTK26DRAFT_7252 [Humicola hyalothermophila]